MLANAKGPLDQRTLRHRAEVPGKCGSVIGQLGQRVGLEAGQRPAGSVEDVALVVGEEGHDDVVFLGIVGRVEAAAVPVHRRVGRTRRQVDLCRHLGHNGARQVDELEEQVRVLQAAARRIVDQQFQAVGAWGERSTSDQVDADTVEHLSCVGAQVVGGGSQIHGRRWHDETVIALGIVVGDDDNGRRIGLAIDRVLKSVAWGKGVDGEGLTVLYGAAVEGKCHTLRTGRNTGDW